ncbi:hypothetical protein D3C86_1564220 [compost metagenome]
MVEVEHALVELDPGVHLVPAHVAHHVVDVLEADRGAAEALAGLVAGQEDAGVVGALDEGVDGVAVGRHAGEHDAAVGVGALGGLHDAGGATRNRLVVGEAGVVDDDGDVLDAVPVRLDVLGDRMIGGEGRGQDEADLALLEHVARAIALARLGAGIGDRVEAEGLLVEVGGLLGVADVEFDVVDTRHDDGIGAGRGERAGHFGNNPPSRTRLRSHLDLPLPL